MKNSIMMSHFAFLVFYISSIAGYGQNSFQITFELHAPGLTSAKTVYITGNLEQLGRWHPDTIKMEFKGQDTWTKSVNITQPVVIEYKYTLGSWNREAVDSSGVPLSNFVAKVSADSIIKDSVLYWKKDEGGLRKSTIIGTVKYHRAFKADSLLPRDILVWLPPGYEQETDRRYPVLYMHDGQNIFDRATSFGNEWRVDESCDSLIRAAKIPPLIVVAINNSRDRSLEYHPGPKGNVYMDFVVNTLKSFVDSVYRTKADAENSIVAGSSSGSIVSFMLAWEYPHVFSKAISMSPPFKIKNIDYVQEVRKSTKRKDLYFFIYNGGIDLEKKLQPGVDQMIAALKEKGYTYGKDFDVVIDNKALHNEKAWARHFPAAIEACFATE